MAINQSAIDRLRLDEAFSAGTVRPFSDCWQVRMDSLLSIVDDDDDKTTRFSDDEEEQWKALVIVNERNRQIVLLSIDNKLIKNHPGGIADCAIFDERQFRFVEFKTNAYGNSEQAIRDVIEKAMSQLVETIKVFRGRLKIVSICLEECAKLSCHIVLSHSFPRSKALKQEYQILFADENEGLGLCFEERTHWELI